MCFTILPLYTHKRRVEKNRYYNGSIFDLMEHPTGKCVRDLQKSLDETLRATDRGVLKLLQNKGTYIVEGWMQKNLCEEQQRT